MANKFKPGIPEGFSLNVEPVRDLGDYLDEPRPVPAVTRKGREEKPQEVPVAPPNEPVASPARETEPAPPAPTLPARAESQPREARPEAPPTHVVMVPQAEAAAPASTEVSREERGGRLKAPRREVTMSPETIRMTDELVEMIRRGSGQRDTHVNELVHALVLLAYEVKDGVDPHSIPRRGRWGTPTARAYPLELKNAFLRALLERHSTADGVIRLKYPVNDAA
ncbi:MAG: hypothetical protein U0797_00965 [Gemmataceae bacterium]